MNKIILILFSILIGFQTINAQENISETEKLYITAKIWGYLKYYHPKVAKGKFNWDEQLFKIIPKVEKSKNKEELSLLFIDWIESLGELKEIKSRLRLASDRQASSSKQSTDYFDKNFDLSWTQDSKYFNTKLSRILKYIEENRFQGKQYYVSANGRIGNIEIKKEPVYNDFHWSDKNLRILALFRYWNVIEYFFPYKYQTDQDWDLVLKEMIPKFLNPKSEMDYHLIMHELVVKINDSHGFFIPKLNAEYFGLKWTPIKFKIIENKVIVRGFYNDSLAKIDDIMVGDIITKINGRTVLDVYKENWKYISASNESTKLRNSYYFILKGSTNDVEIEFLRDGVVSTKSIKRYFFKDFNYEYPIYEKWKILDNNIGFVNMGALKIKEVSKMMEELKNTKAIIFDIRYYPNGTLYAIANHLNKEPKDFVRIIIPDLSYPGNYLWARTLNCGGNGNHDSYTGKIILLINEFTQSHGEFTSMCLQTADNVTVIGSQTAGADGNVSPIELVGGFKTMISGTGIFYPDGSETQRTGIIPDIEIKQTIKGIQEGRDEILEKAIEIINQ